MLRQCHLCGRPIFLCNGMVHAGDLVAAQDGLISWWKVREKCGFCVMKIILSSSEYDQYRINSDDKSRAAS